MRLISHRWLIRRSFTYFYADQEFHQCDVCIQNANNKWKRQEFMKKRIIGITTHETNLASGANDEKVPKLASNRISEFF